LTKILGYDLDVEVLDSGLVRFKDKARGRIREGYKIYTQGILRGIIRFLEKLKREGYSVKHFDRPVLVALIQRYFEVSTTTAYSIANFLILLQQYY